MNWGPTGPYGPYQQPSTPPWWWFMPPQQQQSATQNPDEIRKAYKKGKKEFKQFLKWKEEEDKKKKPEEKKGKLTVVQWTIIIGLATPILGPWVAFAFAASMHASLGALASMLK
jgi:hypothetical protein